MQTICKAVRKQAVCGQKPGGSGAYTLRESCVKKIKDTTKPPQKPRSSKKYDDYIDFVKRDLKKVMQRRTILIKTQLPMNSTLPRAGIDNMLAQHFLKHAKDKQDQSVHSRIKDACDEYNRRLRKNIVLTPILEVHVIISITLVYGTIIEAIG
jgi:hypothetical protein